MRRRTYALLLLLILVALPVLAQDGTPLPPLNLATNTPSNPALIPFATNTPAPTLPAPLPNVTPDAPIDFYALRLWTEQDIVELVEAQAQQAVIGRAGADLATQLTLYEMSRRYPRAPRDLAARESLARTLLSAPNVDARSVVRPVFTPGGNPPNGFTVTSQPVRLNQNEIADELLTVRGPNGYRDYIPVVDGTPLIPNGIPVAPFSGAVELIRAADINADGLDELAVAVDNGDLNITLRLFGVRGEQVVDLTRPNESVRYGAIVDFPQGGEQFLVNEYRPGDSFWGCIEERTIQWTWGANTFTPQPLIDTYFPQDTLACRLPSREALFGGPTAEGVAALETVVDGAELLNNPADEPTLARVNMTLAVLYLFDGRRAEGQTLAASLADMPDTGSWVDAQSRAFLRIFDQGGSNLPLEVCAELDRIADGDGACALGAATEATLNALPLDSTISLEEQLDILGFTVHDNLTVREAGRRDRQVVRFSLSDALWFEFTPAPNLDDPLVFDRYTIALTNTPPQFTPPDPTPTVTDLPQSALDALFLSDEPLAAVNIIDTAQGSSGLPLTDAARYVRALALDLAANRQPAREAYYALWTDAPNTVWGQLAARHLERRG